jgi:hypothetical protein
MKPIAEVVTLEDVFLLMGLVPVDMQPVEVKKVVLRSLKWSLQKQACPYDEKSEGDLKIAPEKLDKVMGLSVIETPINVFWQTRKARLDVKQGDMKKEHEGCPDPSKFEKNRLPTKKCGHCGLEFASREELFRTHLDQVYGMKLKDKKSAFHGLHAGHYVLKAPFATEIFEKGADGKDVKDGSAKVAAWQCNAKNCGEKFKSEMELHKHLKLYGTPGDWSAADKAEVVVGEQKLADMKDGAEKKKDADDGGSLDECIVCFEKQVTTMYMPCGHQHLCGDCAISIQKKQGTCPYCRANITSIVTIYGL